MITALIVLVVSILAIGVGVVIGMNIVWSAWYKALCKEVYGDENEGGEE